MSPTYVWAREESHESCYFYSLPEPIELFASSTKEVLPEDGIRHLPLEYPVIPPPF